MSRLRLGIDLDGVVADFTAGWIDLHRREFGSDLAPDGVTMWDGLHEFAGFPSMDAFWDWARPNGSRPSVFRHLRPLPGALETIRTLADVGHDIVIISAKPDWAVPDTLAWLSDHAMPTREVHLTFDKHEVECDVYLDDAPHVLESLRERRGDRTVCRFVQPWNAPMEGIVDVSGWQDFQRLVHPG